MACAAPNLHVCIVKVSEKCLPTSALEPDETRRTRWCCVAIFKCDSCGYEREVPDKLAGKAAKCPGCGQGVVIAKTSMAEDLAAMFDADVPDAAEREPLNLDSTDVEVDLSKEDNVLCEKCGEVIPSPGDNPRCPVCGHVATRNSVVNIDESGLDVSDLADDTPPQVWESNYHDDQAQAQLDEDEEPGRGAAFFVGNFALNVFAGLVSGVLGLYFALAMSLLVCSWTGTHDFLPAILATALTGMGVGSFFFSMQSKIPFAQAGPSLALTGVLFFFLGAIYRSMEGIYVPETILATLLAAIFLASLVAGIGLWIIGVLKAGNHIRYVPLQIIGGVIGGVGVYIVIGALDWIGRLDLDWNHVFFSLKESVLYLHPAQSLSVMGPSLAFGLILFAGLSKYKNTLFLVCLLLVASAAGIGAAVWHPDPTMDSLGMPIAELKNGVPLFSINILKEGLGEVQWEVIRSHGLYIGALGCLIALSGMYRITRLELIQGREVSMDHELRALGITNCISAVCGGMPVAISFGRSAGSYASGARGPLAGIVAGIVVGTGYFYADLVVPFIPRFVPEGVLLFAGLALVRGWVFKAKTAFTRRDDLWMLWATFIVTIVLGLLIGIGFGVALALIVTVRRNSRGGPIRNILMGSVHRSNVDRAPAQQRILKEYGDHIYIVRLQGFMFLGSMEELLVELRKRLSDKSLLPVEYIILDFHKVTGLASATGIAFVKLQKLMDEYNVEMVIASAPLDLEEHLSSSGHLVDGGGGFRVFLDLDYAMEWCENRVLDSENLLEMKEMSLPALLEPIFPEPKHIPALMKVLKRVVVERGDAVCRQGDKSNTMYFVESGRLDVELETESGKVIRLKKVGPGGVFGEMGIYTLAPRSATVRATEKCVLYLMTREKLDAIEKRAPQLVTSIHRFMINLLAGRLAEANFKVRELMR